ncbi:MAG TPA: DUF1858 domain-containing protein [Xanthobacteraceae bacterium]|nr:DUF1858 domain-containing protein [Xanthobacteraceae bacterium]
MSGEHPPIELTSYVDDVMRRWPATIRTFLDFRMNCVGCPIAIFHTVEDACREHGVSSDRLLQALHAAAFPGNDAATPPRRAARRRRTAGAHRE